MKRVVLITLMLLPLAAPAQTEPPCRQLIADYLERLADCKTMAFRRFGLEQATVFCEVQLAAEVRREIGTVTPTVLVEFTPTPTRVR